MTQKAPLTVAYFSDVLCVWAYTAQVRLDELRRQYDSQIRLHYHFLPVFGCTETRIGEGWRDKGGYAGFGAHVRKVCKDFPHVQVNERLWELSTPLSSANSHLFLKAVQVLMAKGVISTSGHADFGGRDSFEELLWRVRLAFFRDGADVSSLSVLSALAEGLDLPVAAIRTQLENGAAMAGVCRDVELRDSLRVEGSPTYVLNDGRQKLYGNVGYKVIAANVEELLSHPDGYASWC